MTSLNKTHKLGGSNSRQSIDPSQQIYFGRFKLDKTELDKTGRIKLPGVGAIKRSKFAEFKKKPTSEQEKWIKVVLSWSQQINK